MRDFTTTCYNSNLWIKELLELEKHNGKFFYKSKRNQILKINNVIIFGTVLEVRQLDQVQLFTVDDGTGVIVCRRNSTNDAEELEDWDWRNQTLETTREMTVNERTLCDSVFNDQSLQQEDVEANKNAVCKALDSLRWSIVNSFRSSEQIVAGDTVCIYGKIYSYFNGNQIYINVIRPVAIQEELILMTTKLQNTCEHFPEKKLGKNEKDNTSGNSSSSSTYKTEKNSGINSSTDIPQNSIAHPQVEESRRNERDVTSTHLSSSSTSKQQYTASLVQAKEITDDRSSLTDDPQCSSTHFQEEEFRRNVTSGCPSSSSTYKHTSSLLSTTQKSTIACDQSSFLDDLHCVQHNQADSQRCLVNTNERVALSGSSESGVGNLKRRSGLMTFDTMVENRIAGMAGVPENPTIPPSPVTRRGALLIPPTIFEATSTFDTINCYEEEPSVHLSSDDDDDMFVLPTPKKKK